MASTKSGTSVKYTFTNERAEVVTRDAVLCSNSDNTTPDNADLTYFHDPVADSVIPEGGASVFVKHVGHGSSHDHGNGYWDLPTNAPYSSASVGPTGPTGSTGPTGPTGHAGPTGA